MAKKIKSLPESVFVYREFDGDDSYLMVWDTLVEAAENADEGTLIGVYDLRVAGKYKINKEVVEV